MLTLKVNLVSSMVGIALSFSHLRSIVNILNILFVTHKTLENCTFLNPVNSLRPR